MRRGAPRSAFEVIPPSPLEAIAPASGRLLLFPGWLARVEACP